jgi:hypothetical protein
MATLMPTLSKTKCLIKSGGMIRQAHLTSPFRAAATQMSDVSGRRTDTAGRVGFSDAG